MRFSIAAKLGLSAAALVLLVTGLTGYVCYLEAKGTLVEHDLTGMQEEANQIGRQFLEDLDRLRTQALFVSNLPSARSLLERPTDEPEKARENLHFIANQLLENRARSHHLSISLIRLTDGEELFRLQRPEAGKPIEPESRTQRWGQAREFDKLGDLAPTAVLVTDAERREYGPGREYLEMRSLAPVRLSTKGKPVGAIILRMDLSSLLARYAASPRHLVFVTDRDRRFLFHPDQLTGGKVPDGLTAEPLLDGADWLRQPPEPKQVGLVTPADWKPVPHDLGDRSYWLLVSKAIESPDLKGAIEKAWEEQRAAHRAVVFEPLDPARPMRLRLAARDWGELTAIRGALDAAAGPARPGAELTSRLGWEESHCTQYALTPLKIVPDPTLTVSPSGGLLWYGLAVTSSYQEFEADIRKSFGFLFWLVLALSLAAAALALGFSALLTRPIKRLMRATDQVARGDLGHLPPPKAKPRDEMDRLALAYHNMLQQIRQREQALKAAEAHTRTILDQAAEGVFTLDETGTIESFNRAAEEIFEYRGSEVVGKNYRILVQSRLGRDGDSGLFGPSPGSSSGSSLGGGSSMSPEKFNGYTRVVTGRRKNGETFPAEVSVREVPVGDRQVFVAIARDITERVRAQEQAERYTAELDRRVKERTAELSATNTALEQARDLALEAARAKDAFLANMSHELRTPLNAIIGYCEFLQEDPENLDPEEALADLKKIERAGKHLLTLINDILDLAKIEAGKMKLDLGDFEVRPLIRDLEEMMGQLVRAKGNCLTVQATADLGSMRADRHRVKQVVLNLLSNANKFTDKGSILLTAQREAGPGGPSVIFRVADTGKGMSADDVRKLFQPFYQADSSTTRKHEGTGLGLAISRRLCHMMGGEIEVQSRLGEGSTFIIRLPAEVVLTEPAAPALAPRAAEPESGPAAEAPAGPNIVVVIDDDPAVRELMERFLGKEGFAVRTASTGEEGLKMVKQLQPRAVTLDVMMPGGLDGWGVLAALKRDPETADIPIIMSTIVDDRSRGFALGATDYITKPIDWSRLHTVLANLGTPRNAPVLVVEDDPSSRELAKRTLARDGWAVLEADNGKTALAQARKHRPAVILLDLMMPEMDGFGFLEEKRKDPSLADIPVIVVTAADLTEADRRRLNGSVRQIIQKSERTAGDLLTQVRELMQRTIAATPTGS